MDYSRSAPMGARLDAMIAAAEADTLGLKREMGPLSLAALGIATIIGAGIFVLSGDAASQFAGPGVVLSFAIAGIAAAFSALCYAELVSMIPVSGSTYVFAYASLGNFLAWVIGWDLLLEYLLGGSAIAAGWAGYFGNVLGHIGITLPNAITGGPFGGGGVVNLPAVFVVVLVTSVLLAGARESARATSWLVALKLAVLVLFVVVGAFSISSANLHPFVPHNTGHFGAFGWSGVVRAAAVVFFAYIGFDVVCTATQEARNPRRTVPIGLLGALAVATVLYIGTRYRERSSTIRAGASLFGRPWPSTGRCRIRQQRQRAFGLMRADSEPFGDLVEQAGHLLIGWWRGEGTKLVVRASVLDRPSCRARRAPGRRRPSCVAAPALSRPLDSLGAPGLGGVDPRRLGRRERRRGGGRHLDGPIQPSASAHRRSLALRDPCAAHTRAATHRARLFLDVLRVIAGRPDP